VSMIGMSSFGIAAGRNLGSTTAAAAVARKWRRERIRVMGDQPAKMPGCYAGRNRDILPISTVSVIREAFHRRAILA
jgi:hypothetical protein